MNFSIHLPQPLLVNLDNFAKTHKTSRSGVVREAVAQKSSHQDGLCMQEQPILARP